MASAGVEGLLALPLLVVTVVIMIGGMDSLFRRSRSSVLVSFFVGADVVTWPFSTLSPSFLLLVSALPGTLNSLIERESLFAGGTDVGGIVSCTVAVVPLIFAVTTEGGLALTVSWMEFMEFCRPRDAGGRGALLGVGEARAVPFGSGSDDMTGDDVADGVLVTAFLEVVSQHTPMI